MDMKPIRDAVKSVAAKVVTVRTGTVVESAVDGKSIAVQLDSDTSGKAISAQTVAGIKLPGGTRVSCLAYPGGGLLVLGPLGVYQDPGLVDSGWINVAGGVGFQNSWVDFGGGWSPAAYRKVGSRVYVRGLVKSGTVTAGIFALPVGYRPTSGHVMFAGIADALKGSVGGNTGAASAGTAHTHPLSGSGAFSQMPGTGVRIDVLTDGSVYQAQGTNNGFVWIGGSFSVD